MAIAGTGTYHEILGGRERKLVLRNDEIERFEAQYNTGIFDLFDSLFGRGPAPQARHVRDIVALALVGGGMTDRAADDLVAEMPPSENPRLRQIAQRVLGLAFYPAALSDEDKKKEDGSRPGDASQAGDMTPDRGSAASSA